MANAEDTGRIVSKCMPAEHLRTSGACCDMLVCSKDELGQPRSNPVRNFENNRAPKILAWVKLKAKHRQRVIHANGFSRTHSMRRVATGSDRNAEACATTCDHRAHRQASNQPARNDENARNQRCDEWRQFADRIDCAAAACVIPWFRVQMFSLDIQSAAFIRAIQRSRESPCGWRRIAIEKPPNRINWWFGAIFRGE